MTDTDTELAYADTLWKSADALRGQVDAAEYKHVVLGLLFLKYVSDSFDARREELKQELEADSIIGDQQEALLENRDEYTAERVFWVPPEARWAKLQAQATVRAGLRRSVRLLLAKYGYPPDLSEDATQLVLKQAELSTESGT